MISINYKISRNEADEEKVYVPEDAIKTIPDLSVVSGPNSSGKSSLLNFIALAFGGIQSELISDSLKKKIETVSTTERQKSEMTLLISNDSRTLSFEKLPNTNQVRIRENDKPISNDAFRKKYDVLYDIPEDPIARLSGLTKAIETTQNDYKRRVEHLRRRLQSIQIELGDSRNEEDIARLRKAIKDDDNLIAEKEKEYSERIKHCNELKKYAYFKELGQCHSAIQNLERSLSEYKRMQKRASKNSANNEAKKIRVIINKYIESIESEVDELQLLMAKICPKESDKFELLLNCDLRTAFTTFELNGPFKNTIDHLYDVLKDEQQLIEGKSEAIEIEYIVGKILDVLKNTDEGLNIPGFEKTVGEIIEDLEEAKKEYNSIAQKAADVDEAVEHIGSIQADLEQIELEYLPDYKEKVDSDDEFDDDYAEQVKDVEKRLKEKNDYFQKIKAEALECNVSDNMSEANKKEIINAISTREDGAELKVKTFKMLMKMVEDEEQAVKKISDSKTRSQERMNRNIGKLEEAEKKERHPYEGKEEEIQSVILKCDSILKKLLKYDRFIKAISSKRVLDEEGFESYNNAVSLYLGKLEGTIRHVNELYHTQKIDLLNEIVFTQEGKEILFSEMGTGQGQSAYLLSQLSNLEYSKKKIIVLFDEIETMDSKSLLPIKKKLSEMYNKGILIAGIMVEKSDNNLSAKEMEC